MASVEELAKRLRTFADERDWGQFDIPKNLVMAAAGEMGELVVEFQWLTPEQSAAVMDDPEAGARAHAELGNIVIYLTRLADVSASTSSRPHSTSSNPPPGATRSSRSADRP